METFRETPPSPRDVRGPSPNPPGFQETPPNSRGFRGMPSPRAMPLGWRGVGGWAPVAGAAALAIALTLRATAHYGPGAEPDTVTYLAAARHLRAGHGFADMDGSPLTL